MTETTAACIIWSTKIQNQNGATTIPCHPKLPGAGHSKPWYSHSRPSDKFAGLPLHCTSDDVNTIYYQVSIGSDMSHLLVISASITFSARFSYSRAFTTLLSQFLLADLALYIVQFLFGNHHILLIFPARFSPHLHCSLIRTTDFTACSQFSRPPRALHVVNHN